MKTDKIISSVGPKDPIFTSFTLMNIINIRKSKSNIQISTLGSKATE